MNRLQKKCLIASAGLHLLMLAILFVAPAFLSPPMAQNFNMLEIVPPIMTDLAVAPGGGIPEAKPPVTAKPQPTVKEPPKEIVRPPKPEPESVKPLENKPHKPDVSLKPVVRPPRNTPVKPPPTDSSQTERDPARDQAKEFAKAAQSAARSIRTESSSRTTVVMPQGNGGPAFANYKDVLASIYYQNWEEPDDTSVDSGTVVASVTVSRDGKVVSASITKSSGNRAVDRSVEATLNRVKFIAPFPDGTSDEQRTFTINFNAKAKQKTG